MAKTSAIQKNKRRERLVKKYANKRAELKAISKDPSLTPEDQFAARLKLAEMPRNSSRTRVRNRPRSEDLGLVRLLESRRPAEAGGFRRARDVSCL
jgi:hypothetical protein